MGSRDKLMVKSVPKKCQTKLENTSKCMQNSS